MNILVDRLFVIPMSWLLAVPIVLLDRLLARELPVAMPEWAPVFEMNDCSHL